MYSGRCVLHWAGRLQISLIGARRAAQFGGSFGHEAGFVLPEWAQPHAQPSTRAVLDMRRVLYCSNRPGLVPLWGIRLGFYRPNRPSWLFTAQTRNGQWAVQVLYGRRVLRVDLSNKYAGDARFGIGLIPRGHVAQRF